MENRNGPIVVAVTTRASGYAERLAAIALIETRADRPNPITLGADKAYDTADFVMECREHAVTLHVARNTTGSALGDRPGRAIIRGMTCSSGGTLAATVKGRAGRHLFGVPTVNAAGCYVIHFVPERHTSDVRDFR